MNEHGDEPFYTDAFLDEVMGIEGIPPHMYHYTSVDTFAHILKSQKIRFNRLDRVNDAQEAIAADLPLANTTQFVSCWTASGLESIPLWELYTRMSGVRICMPVDMFKGRSKPTIFDRGGSLTVLGEDYSIDRFISDTDIQFFGIQSRFLFGPNPIFYSDREEYQHPNVLVDAGDPYGENIKHVKLNTIDLGCVKGTAWEFEKEWRFKISLFGIGEEWPLDEIGRMKLDFKSNPVSTEFIDITLDVDALNEMQITVAPHISETDLERVKELLESSAPSAVLKRSELNIRKS